MVESLFRLICFHLSRFDPHSLLSLLPTQGRGSAANAKAKRRITFVLWSIKPLITLAAVMCCCCCCCCCVHEKSPLVDYVRGTPVVTVHDCFGFRFQVILGGTSCQVDEQDELISSTRQQAPWPRCSVSWPFSNLAILRSSLRTGLGSFGLVVTIRVAPNTPILLV